MAVQKECMFCGETFTARNDRQKLCPDCKEIKSRAGLYPDEEPKKPAPKAEPKVKTVDAYCRGCVHLVRVSCDATRDKACDFIGHTGRRRPCPAGKGCTERKTSWGDGEKRWEFNG